MGRMAQAARRRTRQSQPVARADAATVLVVDDDAAFRALLRQLLEDEGFEVLAEAVNGAEAIELAAVLRPDVITMDLEMPVRNGVEATAAICADGCATVVIVSGSTSSERLGDALEAGARWHVPKRVVAEQLPFAVAALARARHHLTLR